MTDNKDIINKNELDEISGGAGFSIPLNQSALESIVMALVSKLKSEGIYSLASLKQELAKLPLSQLEAIAKIYLKYEVLPAISDQIDKISLADKLAVAIDTYLP